MKLLAHAGGFAAVTPGGLVDLGVPDLATLVATFDARAVDAGRAVEPDRLRPAAPLVTAGKVLCVMRNRPDPSTFAYLKHPALGLEPGRALTLTEPGLRYEAKLAAIVRGPARHVAAADWRSAIFGFTAFLDVTREPVEFPPGVVAENWERSWDTPYAAGPCIVTADELSVPGQGLELTAGGVRHADPGAASIGELVAFLSGVMTLRSGDVIVLGGHDATVVPAGGAASVTVPGIGVLDVVAA